MLGHLGDTDSFAPLIDTLTQTPPFWFIKEFPEICCDLIHADLLPYYSMDDLDEVIFFNKLVNIFLAVFVFQFC